MSINLKRISFLFVIAITLVNCKQEPTLQTYYVDHELKPGFSVFDLPTSFVKVEEMELTDEQKEAYESVDKLNILMLRSEDTNSESFKTELKEVKTILKNDIYEELIRGGNNQDGKFHVSFIGDIENIDELVLFGHANNKGFVVARVLGDDMNANKLMSLRNVLNSTSFEDSKLKELRNFFN